jgi:NADH-quinone oxidoreductase subunit L
MTVPLVILAAGSLVVGFLGVPEFLGGTNRFEAWLAPVFAHGAHAAAAHGAHAAALEWSVMLVSVGVAGAGFAIAYLLYYARAWSADAIAGLAGGTPYRLLYNKYYVDELYNAVFVRGTLLAARFGAWFDLTVIDGIVDGSARLTAGFSWLNGLFDNHVVDRLVNILADRTFDLGTRLRRVQTGSINAYLYVIVGAVTAVLIARLM